jgi:predicted amidohydrolase
MLVGDDPDVNLRKILTFLDTAAGRRSDIVCFPEACLVNDYRGAVVVDGYLDEIRAGCRDLSIWCLFGTYARERSGIKNLAYLVDRRGEVAYKYTKVNLYRDELGHGVLPGSMRSNRVVATELGRLGVILCFDFAYPEYVKRLSLQGAEIIFCPSFMVDHRGWSEMFRSMPVTRAFENSSYFVLCDATTRERRTAGITRIAGPKGTLASLEDGEGIVYANLDMRRIRKLKERFGILRR